MSKISFGIYKQFRSTPCFEATSLIFGNKPISNSNPKISTVVIFFKEHSLITSSTKSLVTCKLKGPTAIALLFLIPLITPKLSNALAL